MSKMSVVGFDLGNDNCVVVVAGQMGIDAALNDGSHRETPALVCFGDKQRFLGTAGATSAMMNPKNTISQIKRLVGRPFSDPELQQDLKALPFSVTEGPDGFPLIHARYLGETKTFTPTQVMGMVFSNMKTIAEKTLNSAVAECCIGIPVYFTDLQRRAVLNAATIAGLRPLRFMHETTATALAYGTYKTDLPENKQLNVAFVDIGHASMQVCIAGFKKGMLTTLAHSFDRCLGGRDFDEVLFQYFAENFKADYKIDVFQNAKASLRLRAACEKLKKVLSANPEAPLNIECLMDDKDVRGYIKRDEFERISTPILERVKKPLERALLEAQLTVDDIYAVEVVGSGSRVPAIIKILTEFFGKEPRRTMNASECVAKGCALLCASFSPAFKASALKFNAYERFPFPIAMTWRGTAQDSQNRNTENQPRIIVFPKGKAIPALKELTFYRSGTFTVGLQYEDVSELQAPTKISTYTIGPFQTTKGERAKVKVKTRLDGFGILRVESAELIGEEEIDVQMGAAAKVEAPKKKVKSNIPVSESVYGAMLPADLVKAVEKELEMALQDRIMEETKDKKNAVEAYVYDMRNKLGDKLHDFVTDLDRKALLTKLQETQDWIYGDGEDETKDAYIAKLNELKKQGNPVEQRYKEHSERGSSVAQLLESVKWYKQAAHQVLNECSEVENWLREKTQLQNSLPKHADPVLQSSDMRKKEETLKRICGSILTKP
ncbi:hypothetical protein SSX86_021170 [Deinandra increscens subsp. villosa]|uniref:Uncharacterized protein n=1 Tax=Deinandra increscens subsp. villosa TaxID=3103831 RepID=A0AAP0GSV6_9ASTR